MARVSAEEKEKRGASVEPELGGSFAPPSWPASGASADTAANPARGVAKNDGATAAAPPRDAAKKRGGASATKTIAPPEASDAAPSVSRATGAALGTTPSRRGVKGATTSNANPGGIRAWFDSAGDRRAPTATFAEGRRAGAANVASEALPGVSATGANVPNVAASESSADTARRRAPVSVTRAPPCGVTDTGDTSRIVGGGVATSVAAALALAPTPNASAPASATRAACAPAGSDVGVSHATSAEETATATGTAAANGDALALDASAHTSALCSSRRRSAPETKTTAPPPACAAVGASARARAARRTRRKSASGTLGPRRARLFF